MVTHNFPTTQVEFDDRFSTNEACYQYLADLRWPDGFVCPHCGHQGGRRRPDREEFVCGNKECRKETSLRSGTVLHNSPKPLRTWLWAMFLMSQNKQGISALRLQNLMGFGCYRTALRWLRELRRAMSHVVDNHVLANEVEVDEMYVGRRYSKLEPNLPQTEVRVVGAVEVTETGCGRTRLRVVAAEKPTESIKSFVRQSVRAGAFLYSDGLDAYQDMASEGYHVDARAVSEKGRAKRKEDGTPKVMVHLPRIHRVFSLVKRVLLGAHQGACSRRHLQGYLDEYCFRFNRRNDSRPFAIAQRLASSSLEVKAVPYWQSSGRTEPSKSTRVRTTIWKTYAKQFAEDLRG